MVKNLKLIGRKLPIINLIDTSKEYVKSQWKHILVKIIAVICFISIWHLLIIGARSNIDFLMQYRLHDLPTPGETWKILSQAHKPEYRGIEYHPSLFDHAYASIKRVLIGFGVASIVGIPLGLLMGRYIYAKDFGGIIVELLRPIPPIAWIPLVFFVFLFNAPYFIVFIGAVFPIILSTINGAEEIDEGLVDAAKTLGANRMQTLRKVIIPASLPSIITGMRIGLGVGWMCIVAAEMVAMKEGLGLGYYVWSNYDPIYFLDKVVAGVVLIGIIGWFMNIAIENTEKYLMKWQE